MDPRAWSARSRLFVLAAGALVAGLLSVRLLALAGPPPGPQVWACGESLKVAPSLAPQPRNSVWNAETRTVRLYSARQEYVGFQVIVRAGAEPLNAVETRLTPLRSASGDELTPSNVDLFLEHYLRVSVPSQHDNDVRVPEAGAGEYPAQMVPLRDPRPGRTFAVPAGRNQPVWIDLYVPEEQPPGDYQGEVRVLAEGRELAVLKVRLTVWSFTLPHATHLKTYLPTGPENLRWAFGLRKEQTQEVRALEDRCFQMAHQHRLNFNPSSGEDEDKEWGGRYHAYLDGSAFKERAGAGVGQSLLVIALDSDSPAEIGAYLKRTLAWWKREKLPARLVYELYDEPKDEADFASVAARAKAVRAAVGSQVPTFLTTEHPERVPLGLVDIWGEIPAAQVPARQQAGQRVWAVNQGYAGGPYVDTPGYSGRSQAWMAWTMKLDAWYFWDCCYWMDRQNRRTTEGGRIPSTAIDSDPKGFLTDTWSDPLTFDQKRNPRLRSWIRLNGDGVLFYPGTPLGLQEPLAGFTMKSLRRGLQDYEYLWLLRERGKPADDIVDRLVRRPESWARDPDAWDQARIELGERLNGRQ